MLGPDEILRWAEGKFPSFVTAHFSGENWFPLDVPRFGRIETTEAAADIDRDIRRLLAGGVEVTSPDLPASARPRQGLGYSVTLRVTRTRRHGEQPLPDRVWFETAADYLAFLGKTQVWHQLGLDMNALSQAGSAVVLWAKQNARSLVTRMSPGDGTALALALTALHDRPHPACFAREINLPGISGKFMEERLPLIADILREIESPAWRPGTDAHAQLGLRRPSRLLRLMRLDGSRFDFGVSQERFLSLPEGCDRLLIVENLRSFLTLPIEPRTMAIFGAGHAVQTLADLPDVTGRRVYYWGDLDPTGLSILNSLRRLHPTLISVLMDSSTLVDHPSLIAPAPRLKQPFFDLLTTEERAGAEVVQRDGSGIEQEKLPPAYAHEQLLRALSGMKAPNLLHGFKSSMP